jgi:hypothetical protein
LFKWLLFDCLRFKIQDFGGLLAIGYWLLAALTKEESSSDITKLPGAKGQKPEAKQKRRKQ